MLDAGSWAVVCRSGGAGCVGEKSGGVVGGAGCVGAAARGVFGEKSGGSWAPGWILGSGVGVRNLRKIQRKAGSTSPEKVAKRGGKVGAERNVRNLRKIQQKAGSTSPEKSGGAGSTGGCGGQGTGENTVLSSRKTTGRNR